MAKVSKRGGFSDRNKIKPENTEIQLKEFDKRTRVQLQNMISQFYQEIYGDEYYGGENIQEFLDMLSEPFIQNQWILDGLIAMMMC